MSSPQIDWISDTECRVGDTAFRFSFGAESRPDSFCIRKPRELLDATVALLTELRPKRIVELGIAQGGSTALLDLLAPEARILSIELSPDRIPALDEHLRARGRTTDVRAEYGTSQDDTTEVGRFLQEHFGDEPLDLVIDDASHYLDPTATSFDLLFPLLRTGGVYVIEDWRWQHKLHHGVREDWGGPNQLERALTAEGSAEQARARRKIAQKLAERAAAAGHPGSEMQSTSIALPATEDTEQSVVRDDADSTGRPSERPDLEPLSRLVLQLVLAHADDVTALSRLTLDDHWVRIDRGPRPFDRDFRLADIAPDPFDLLAP